MTTLENIRTKVRRLTASPSSVQLTDAVIDGNVNTFYLHDMPQYLRLFSLKDTYTFYTSPNVDVYDLNDNPSFTDTTPRAYYSVEPPVYIAGYESFYTQAKDEFYRLYPYINSEQSIPGTNVAGAYAITITDVPVITGAVIVSATDAGDNRLIAIDDGVGGFTGDITSGAINYITGAITNLTFTGIIPVTEDITVQYVPYTASRPSNVLFFNNQFILRPIPDKTYRVDITAYVYPTALLNAGDSPEAQFLWQLLALGASRKILEDRGDSDSLQTVMTMFNEQMILCQRRTIEQNRSVRAATIYSSQVM